MKPSNTAMHWRSAVSTAALLAVLAGACSSTGAVAPDGPQPSAPTTREVAARPETVRDELVAAIAAQDESALRSLWPAASWDTIGRDVLADFEPSSDNGDSNLLSDIRAQCFVFQRDLPFVLGLTIELTGAGSWSIVVVSLDSTD